MVVMSVVSVVEVVVMVVVAMTTNTPIPFIGTLRWSKQSKLLLLCYIYGTTTTLRVDAPAYFSYPTPRNRPSRQRDQRRRGGLLWRKLPTKSIDFMRLILLITLKGGPIVFLI